MNTACAYQSGKRHSQLWRSLFLQPDMWPAGVCQDSIPLQAAILSLCWWEMGTFAPAGLHCGRPCLNYIIAILHPLSSQDAGCSGCPEPAAALHPDLPLPGSGSPVVPNPAQSPIFALKKAPPSLGLSLLEPELAGTESTDFASGSAVVPPPVSLHPQLPESRLWRQSTRYWLLT